MLPILVSLPELVQANEVSIEDRHVAPVDRNGLFRDEKAVRGFRKSRFVTLDKTFDGFTRSTFHLEITIFNSFYRKLILQDIY